MEPDEQDIAAGIEDGELLDPHGMDPQTVLRFVRAVGGWPGKVVVIACEPAEVEEMGIGLSAGVSAAVEHAAELVATTIEELRADAAPAG
jgi:hydrogenase maturation protease